MRKIFMMFALFFCFLFANAKEIRVNPFMFDNEVNASRSELFEGYEGMPWNTSLNIFLKRNSDAKEVRSLDYGWRHFERHDGRLVKLYRFYDGCLQSVTLSIINPSDDDISSFSKKLIKELNDDYELCFSGKRTFHADKYCDFDTLESVWNISMNMTVRFKLIYCNDKWNTSVMSLTYENTEVISNARKR